MQRLGEQICYRRFFHDLARIQDRGAFTQLRDRAEIVRDVERGSLIFADQIAEQVENDRLGGDIQRGGGFVQHQQTRLSAERHRNCDTLLHPAAELVRVAPGDGFGICDFDAPQHLDGPCPGLCMRKALVKLRNLGDLVADPVRRVERRQQVLRDKIQVAAPYSTHLAH